MTSKILRIGINKILNNILLYIMYYFIVETRLLHQSPHILIWCGTKNYFYIFSYAFKNSYMYGWPP